MPLLVHEVLVAPLVLFLSYRHLQRAVGSARAVGELLALTAYGYSLEAVAMAVFGSHRYGERWAVAPGGVPLAVAVVWAALIAASMTLAARRHPRRPMRIAAQAALLGVSLDLLVEPAAIGLGFWSWTPRGPWLGIPLGNFVGWAVIVGVYTFGAERWGGASRRAAFSILERVLLAAASVTALVAVGLAWRAGAVETRLTSDVGWAVAALVWSLGAGGLPAGLGGAREESGLATRLAQTGGFEPAAILLLLAAVFAADALLLGGLEHVVLAVAAPAALLAAVARSGPLSPGTASSG